MKTNSKHNLSCDYIHFLPRQDIAENSESSLLSRFSLQNRVKSYLSLSNEHHNHELFSLKDSLKDFFSIISRISYVFAIYVIIFTIYAPSSFSSNLQVPAEFVMRLQPPGNNNDFLRPSDIYIDNNNGEVFVGDPGNNRVLIFDSTGTYQFEFAGNENFSTPVNIVVNSEGYIYVLGSTRQGRRIVKFDFDGLYLKKFPVPVNDNDEPINFASLSIDVNDNLYVYEQQEMKIYTYDNNDSLVNSFAVLTNTDSDDSRNRNIVISSITVHGDNIYIPFSSLGHVQIYSLNGQLRRSIGRQGNLVGELNFPVKVQIANDNIIMVLDKHRINVVCYAFDGKFLGEFGGKGSSPGWFYHPTILEANNQNQVYIGQIFENKIQLCQIPQFITDKASLSSIDSHNNQEGK